MIQVTTGSDAVISSPTFVGVDGYTPTDPTGTPTVTLTRGDGTTVAFTGPTAGTAGDGLYTITVLAAALAAPDRLTATWTGTVSGNVQQHVQQIDVVGGVYVPLIDLWNLPDLSASKFTAQILTDLRIEFEDIAERWTGQAWVPRYATELHPCRYSSNVLLEHTCPRSILGAVDDLTAVVDVTYWEPEVSGLVRNAIISRPTTITYIHGADAPPAALVQACKDYVRSKALERIGGNRVGRDVLSFSDGSGGSTNYSTPDWDAGRPTGYLDVDRVLNALGAPVPGIA